MMARAIDSPSVKVTGLFAEHVLPRVRMDYGFLTERIKKQEGEHGESTVQKAEESLTVAVMNESLTSSVWAYAVEHKGSREGWVVEQVLEDLQTVGLKNDRIVLKSDQEPAIVDMMTEIQKRRESDYGTALDTSRVGDSNSNATIENSIKSVMGMIRTLRFALQEKLGSKIGLDHAVVPWMVRHAAMLITRYWIKPSGKTSYQLIKGRRGNTKMYEFGEAVWFKIPKTKRPPGKFEEQWEGKLSRIRRPVRRRLGSDQRRCLQGVNDKEETT